MAHFGMFLSSVESGAGQDFLQRPTGGGGIKIGPGNPIGPVLMIGCATAASAGKVAGNRGRWLMIGPGPNSLSNSFGRGLMIGWAARDRRGSEKSKDLGLMIPIVSPPPRR